MNARGTTITWGYLFIDVPVPHAEAGWAFWSQITGCAVSTRRGNDGEFATLLPPVGDPFVKLQATRSGQARTHLDLVVTDLAASRAAVVDAGGEPIATPSADVEVMRSPGGYDFCFVRDTGPTSGRRTSTVDVPAVADQLCFDVPDDRFDLEVQFWSTITGWPVRSSDDFDEFVGLARPDGFPLRLLFQRLGSDDPRTTVTGHPDLMALRPRATLLDHHLALGATVDQAAAGWTVLRDPVGLTYCLCAPPDPLADTTSV